MGETIELISFEGKSYKVPHEIVELSEFLREIPDVSSPIYLDALEIDSETLDMIIDYLSYHRYNPPVYRALAKDIDIKTYIDPWDRYFFEKTSQENQLKLLLAAKRLDLYPLQTLICIEIACYLKDLNVKDYINDFHLFLDMDEDTEELLKIDNYWALEETSINSKSSF
ncbi:unnamed protein product [Blepharisma stoltei]|uniref:SKP1 component POZ domain-containing protein n=1 Tax=Blepharisma stoltei TaxID=1481888 RepID=A0AAU9IZP2_9CILI|nr:unnamed protein product [Blepharisma stoltei]